MKKGILFLICLAACQSLFSTEVTDSIPKKEKKEYRFSPSQLIVPASLITVSSLGLTNGYLKSVNEDVKDEMAKLRSKPILLDDYIQYLPVVSVYGLSLAGVKPKHDYFDRTLIVATSYLSMGIMVNAVKYTIREPRPDSHAQNSFLSGHTATAFMGAELVRIEYGNASPVYGILAYTTAIGVGFSRVYNERHWSNDVIAGAGFGILSARIGYWLLPVNRKIFNRNGNRDKKDASQIAIAPYYTGQQGGIALSYHF
ncbi:phospholipid phosphatase [Bacteroidia bacterium]|nr:phospholipid phosphatase [Bacteroidia bacterium]GHT84174.1 phospholipid phosphatase [Bacteroidia bacterium]